jgi:hypothetical protein
MKAPADRPDFCVCYTIFLLLERYYLQAVRDVICGFSDQKKVNIMAKLKGNAAVITGASKSIGAANARALAFWGACWMIGLAVPVTCGGR